MDHNPSYTIEELAQLLKVSKLTVYDLVKKGDIASYKVGRQMRVDHEDLERYKNSHKSSASAVERIEKISLPKADKKNTKAMVISGQDIVLDLLAKQLEMSTKEMPLRAYSGSLNSLVALYNGNCDVVSVHLYDGDTNTYNLPYVKRLFASHSFCLINLVCRNAGLYVQKGNRLGIKGWKDFNRSDLVMVNREKGSGARILLDEKLRLHHINRNEIKGYDKEVSNHYSVASAIASGEAQIGVGIENTAKLVNVDFIPLIQEQYDLVLIKTKENMWIYHEIMEAIRSNDFQTQLKQLSGYDVSKSGQILYET